VIALARKYRPRNFAEVAVQTHVSNTLRGAIARGRVAHGYLLCGPRGVGKTTLARVLAMALNCENRGETGEPCGTCESCTRIWSGSASLDVVEIDAASNRGVDDARELRERAMYAPSSEHRWKVYIIDEAHMLTREAWNALLKILEEPPPRVVFVFATTEPHKIAQFAAPVLSRLQRFDFKRIGPADIRARLTSVLDGERIEAEPEALAMIARAADGSMRDALSLTDQVLALGDGRVTAERAREALGIVPEDEYLALLDVVSERRAGDVFASVARLVDLGADLGQFLTGFGEMLRAQLAVKLGGDPGDLSERARTALEERKDRLATGDLLRMLTMLSELEPRFRRSTQQQLLLETTLVRFALLDRTLAIEDLLREIGPGGPDRPDRGEPPRPPGAGRRTSAAAEGGQRGERGEGRRTASPGDTPPAVPRMFDGGHLERRSGPPTASLGGGLAVAEVVTRDSMEPAFGDGARTAVAIGVPADDINAIAGAWDDVVAAVRRELPLVATLLEQAIPIAASTTGVLTLQVESPSVQDGLEARCASVVSALARHFTGLQRLVVKETLQPEPASGRMTVDMVRSGTLASLRRRDPVLAAAIDLLDLDLAD
jgi:DNA polymerase-3 subunit gamma/tau